jgi:predicted lipid carrier protein YhbT
MKLGESVMGGLNPIGGPATIRFTAFGRRTAECAAQLTQVKATRFRWGYLGGMITDARAPAAHSPAGSETPAWPRLALAPLPLFPLQPLLGRIVRKIAAQRPKIFGRIGPHTGKCFLIDPVNMPFVLMLYPDPAAPRLKAARRHDAPAYDACIAGSFLTLLDVVDGRLDGDALFFTRGLTVEGDTEATVCLRNALDDLEGSIADDVAAMFGPPGQAALALLRRARPHNDGS